MITAGSTEKDPSQTANRHCRFTRSNKVTTATANSPSNRDVLTATPSDAISAASTGAGRPGIRRQ